MGLLMLAGLVGTMAYGAYATKKEATAIMCNGVVKGTGSFYKNKKIIDNHFELICKHGTIELDRKKNPVFKDHYKSCMAYLTWQGFDEESIEYFKKEYLRRYNESRNILMRKIEQKHKNILATYNTEPKRYMTYKRSYGGDAKSRMDKIMKNKLWATLVESYNVVPDGWKKYEIWNLRIPNDWSEKKIDKIYDEVTFAENFYPKDNKILKKDIY